MTKIQELAAQLRKEILLIIHPNERRDNAFSLIEELASIAEAPLVVGSRYDIPPDSGDNTGFSDNYLIDLNGHRTDFGIGHYDHTYDRWIIHDDDKRSFFKPDHMTWQRLPLAKYDS